jgi:hypothetical protein
MLAFIFASKYLHIGSRMKFIAGDNSSTGRAIIRMAAKQVANGFNQHTQRLIEYLSQLNLKK